MRPELVSKRYVNNVLSAAARRSFSVEPQSWNPRSSEAESFETLLLELLHDWGTSLELSLYEEALTHFLGGEAEVIRPATVSLDGHEVGAQTLRFASPGTAFKLTAFKSDQPQDAFLAHAEKLVAHTSIDSLFWANINHHKVTFRTVTSK